MDFGTFDLAELLPFIAVGFAAQLVDGALGMAFGVISNTLLVGVLGVAPAMASQREVTQLAVSRRHAAELLILRFGELRSP